MSYQLHACGESHIVVWGDLVKVIKKLKTLLYNYL